MDGVTKQKRLVRNVKIETYKTEIVSDNVLEVEVGTNGFMGEDAEHLGRTYLSIKGIVGTDIEVRTINKKGFEVELGGDTELSTFIEALEFALQMLKVQSKIITDR